MSAPLVSEQNTEMTKPRREHAEPPFATDGSTGAKLEPLHARHLRQMKTAVEIVFIAKDRQFNRRFLRMCGHYWTAHGRDHRGPGSGQDIDGYTAVDRISFSVAAGRIFAFIGPNGADKTTTIKDANLT